MPNVKMTTAIVLLALLVPALADAQVGALPPPDQPVLRSAMVASNAAVLTSVQNPSPQVAREISSKRSMGLVKIIIGSIAAVTGVSYMAAGGTVATVDGGGGIGTAAMVIGGGLGGGGAWLIYDGVRDRADAAALEAGETP